LTGLLERKKITRKIAIFRI